MIGIPNSLNNRDKNMIITAIKPKKKSMSKKSSKSFFSFSFSISIII